MVIASSVAGDAAEWPSEGLEFLGRCPACGSEARSLLMDGLRDTTFYAAPGGWTLWRCRDCRSGSLDPRPTPETLHLAYSSYYTHSAPHEPRGQGTAARAPLWRRAIPAAVGRLMKLYQGRYDNVDYVMRYLPHPSSSSGMLLDIGCGNGAFLRMAEERGWVALGCDPDPAAVAAAGRGGRTVRQGGPESFSDHLETFDAITLNHVIEHVPDPLQFLTLVRTLMRPGGHLYIDTPNIDALGVAKFGPNWRGLEPPRHLVLFNWESLSGVLEEAGFERIEWKPQPRVALELWTASERMARGRSPNDHTCKPGLPFLKHILRLRRIPVHRTEFLTLIARAPER